MKIKLPAMLQSCKINLRLNLILICVFTVFGITQAQVTLTATSGSASGSFTTLKGAFDAINLGAHQGAIVISINASTTESTTAVLEASGANGFSSYTSISIYPTSDGVSISGPIDGNSIIRLSGADNVTIDGRVNANGSSKSLTITNTSVSNLSGTSTIQFFGDASSNTVKYCTLKGSTKFTLSGIVFFNTGTSTGNDNNTIDNNDITSNDDIRPLNAIYASGNTDVINNNNSITNNNIFNFLDKATNSYGINIGSFNSTYTITGNSFYQTAEFSPTANVNYFAISISAGSGGEGFIVSNNYIGGTAPLCGGGAWTKTGSNNSFTGIVLSSSNGVVANSIQGNTIQNINWTNTGNASFSAITVLGATNVEIGTTTGNLIGAASGNNSILFIAELANIVIINLQTSGNVNCKNNTIGAIRTGSSTSTTTNTCTFIGIQTAIVSSGSITISNNTIGSTSTAGSIIASSTNTANQGVQGIRILGAGTHSISGNTIANLINSGSGTGNAGMTCGINATNSGTNNISNNTIRDLYTANNNTNTTVLGSINGITLSSTTGNKVQTVSGNTVYNLTNYNADFSGEVRGIYFEHNTTATSSTVSGNFIHSISVIGASSTSANVYGIKIVNGATTSSYSNNIISLGGNTTTNVYGIYEQGTASTNNKLYFNTVYLSGIVSQLAYDNKSYALYSATGVSTNNKDFRNNVLVNARSTSGGANKHYALWFGTGGTVTIDFNNYYVSGSGGTLGAEGPTNVNALPIVSGNDANSIVTNPSFVSTGTTASGFKPTLAGTGATNTGITVDYNGSSRVDPVRMGAFNLSPKSWTGGSGNVSTAANWSDGVLPDSNDDIVINSGNPQLDVNFSINGSLTLASSTSLNLSSFNLTLTGNLTNNGTISGSGILSLSGSTAQTVSGTGSVKHITVNNAAGVTVASGSNKLNVLGVLTPTAGTITTNGNLVLKSTATEEGTIGAVATCPTNPFSGNVTVERYIPANKRAYRFLTPGVTTSTSINANWQEGATSSTNNPNPGYGTHITGSTSGANGLDATITGSASLYSYNASNQLWSAITNTTTPTFKAGEGYQLMVRGSRAIDLTNVTTPTPDNTVIRSTGTLSVCDVSFTTSSAVPLSSAATGWSFIGNPYWSIVDLTTVTKSNIESTYYYWDPTLTGSNNRGAYATLTIDGVGGETPNNLSSQVSKYLQPGQGFFIRNTSSSPSLTFKESDKVTSAANKKLIFQKNPVGSGMELGAMDNARVRGNGSSVTEKVYLSLFIKEKLNVSPADGFALAYNSRYKNTQGAEDAAKFTNPDENIAAMYNSTRFSILGMQTGTGVNSDTIPIAMWNLNDRDYVLQLNLTQYVDPQREIFLLNRVSGIATKVDNTGTFDYAFRPVTGVRTKDDLAIVFNTSRIAPKPRSRKDLVVFPNPTTTGVVQFSIPNTTGKLNLSQGAQAEVFDATGRSVMIGDVEMVGGSVGQLDLTNLSDGAYTMKVTIGGQVFMTKVIKQ